VLVEVLNIRLIEEKVNFFSRSAESRIFSFDLL
jgi:hypothetical protein